MRFDFFGKPKVIGVLKRNKIPFGHFQTVISRRSRASVSLRCNDLKAVVSEARNYLEGFIRRAIVDNNDLDIAISLITNASQATDYFVRAIENWDYDAYQRLCPSALDRILIHFYHFSEHRRGMRKDRALRDSVVNIIVLENVKRFILAVRVA